LVARNLNRKKLYAVALRTTTDRHSNRRVLGSTCQPHKCGRR